MAAAQGLYAAQNTNVTNSTHPTYTDCASIAAGSFTADKEYLIIGVALLECAGGANEHHVRLVHGSTNFTDADAVIDPPAANGGAVLSWMYRLSQGASPEAVTIQAAGEAVVATVLGSQVFALKLSDDFTENTDYFWNEVTADYTTTATPTAQAAATFTPNGTDDWLIIGHFVQGLPSGVTTNFLAELHDSVGATTAPALAIESEDLDAGDEARSYILARAYTPTNAAHTYSLRFAHAATETFVVFSSRVLAINLNKFNQHIAAYTDGATTPAASPTWTTVATASVAPSVTGDWWYMGMYVFDAGAATAEQNIRLQDDNSGSLVSDPAYGDDGVNPPAWDATDDMPMALMTMKALATGGTRTINMDVTTIAGSGTAKQRSLVGFSLELAGGAAPTSLIIPGPRMPQALLAR
jgi:hypothetical protein